MSPNNSTPCLDTDFDKPRDCDRYFLISSSDDKREKVPVRKQIESVWGKDENMTPDDIVIGNSQRNIFDKFCGITACDNCVKNTKNQLSGLGIEVAEYMEPLSEEEVEMRMSLLKRPDALVF